MVIFGKVCTLQIFLLWDIYFSWKKKRIENYREWETSQELLLLYCVLYCTVPAFTADQRPILKQSRTVPEKAHIVFDRKDIYAYLPGISSNIYILVER